MSLRRNRSRTTPSSGRPLRFERLEAKLALDSGVIFNEIMYHPADPHSTLEWVELYNQMCVDIDISEWTLQGGVDYQFPEGTIIPGEGYVIVAADPLALRDIAGVQGAFGPWEGRLDSGGEEIRLHNNSGRLLNAVDYDDSGSWPLAPDGSGTSLAKKDPTRSDNGPGVWTSSNVVGGTPGRANFTVHDERIEETILPYTAAWKYEQSGTDLGAAWIEPGYDDSTWPSGPGLLYVESAELPAPKGTELTLGPQTFYFRSEFQIADLENTVYACVNPIIDDGAVFYVNGAEIGRFNMPEGNVTHSTAAASPLSDASVSGSIYIPMDLLQAGANTLAVEVHQHGGTSSDVVMGAAVVIETINQAPYAATPKIVFNEVNVLDVGGQALFYVELFNQSDTYGVDLQGYRIKTSLGRSFIFASSNYVSYGDHHTLSEHELGFRPEAGERLYLVSPNGSRVFDAVEVQASPLGRLPDGTGPWYTPDVPTPGFENSFDVETGIVINEIMYHHRPLWLPEYTESGEEWIELYNRSDAAVDLSGWSFTEGVKYVFPQGTVLNPGEYLVVAGDAAALAAKYPTVPVLGNLSGSLANDGERILLLDTAGNPADEVYYYDEGNWPGFADGAGSSLELRNPDTDNSVAESWAASNEGDKGQWQTITYRGVAMPSTCGPDGTWHEFAMALLDPGEVLVDDVSVIESPRGAAKQLIQNGAFDTTGAWRILGTHETSRIVADPDDPGNNVLHLISTGRADDVHNHAETTFIGNVDIVNGREYEISFRVKWLAGSPLFHTRLYFQRLAQTTLLVQPETSGTPGARNSTYEANVGPTFTGVSHSPAVPRPGEQIRVEAYAADPDGVAECRLWYRWNDGQWQNIRMGHYGDGRYDIGLSGKAASSVLQFYVEAVDRDGATAAYPAAGPDSGAYVKVYDGLAATNGLHNFRIVMSQSDSEWLHDSTNVLSNARTPATVIYNESQVYYDVGVKLKGSERGRDGDIYVGFNVEFNPDQLFNGIHPSVVIDRSEVYVTSQREFLYRTLVNNAGEFISFYNDLVQVIPSKASLTSTGELMLTRFGDELLDTQYENGSDGYLYKLELIYYPLGTVGGSPEAPKLATPYANTVPTITSHGSNEENYRWNFLNEINRAEDNFGPCIRLVSFLGSSGVYFYDRLEQFVDVDQFLRGFAFAELFGARDNYSDGFNHNAFFYIRPDGRAVYFPHDLDGFFEATNSLFSNNELIKITQQAKYKRLYYGHIHDIISTTYNRNYMSYWTTHYGELLPGQNFAGHLDFINTRSNFALNYVKNDLPQVPFNITTNGGQPFFDADEDGKAILTGTGWVNVRNIYLAGAEEPLPVTWMSLDDWRVNVPLNLGENAIVLEARDFRGNVIATDTIVVTSNVDANPVPEHLRISEIHYHPSPPTAAEQAVNGAFGDEDFEFIELVNTSGQVMDLSGVRILGGVAFDFTGSAVTSLGPGEFVLVAGNRAAFTARYGEGLPVAGQYTGRLSNGGEDLALYDAFGFEVLAFAYSDDPPWPGAADGAGPSLEIIDTEGDYSDPENWRASAVSGGTPGAENSPPLLPGDLDGDAVVDSADLDIIRAHWGRTVAPGSLADGDANGDGTVGSADLDLVRANWGTAKAASVSSPRAAAADAVHAATTEESPASGRSGVQTRQLAQAAWLEELHARRTASAKRPPGPERAAALLAWLGE